MRSTRKLGASCALAAAAVAAAIPVSASASPSGQNPIETGENITAVHNIDFVATFGVGNLGDDVIIQVLRGDSVIAQARGPLVDTPEGPGLEANHGPEGTPQPGDCWENVTADIKPFDLVRVTNTVTGDVDEALIDELTFDNAAVVGGEAHYTGVARFANGTPIPAIELNSGFWRTDVGGVDSRGENPFVETDVDGNYTARWQPPDFGVFVGNTPTASDVASAARQEFGYGHVVPLPLETQLADGLLETPGPALGCEGSPEAAVNDITAFSDPIVNLTSGELTASGVAHQNATSVNVTIDDANPATAAVTATMTGPAGGAPGRQHGWSATFSEADLATLDDGTLTATAEFDAGPATATREIQKDTTPPPAPQPSDPPATGGGGAAGGATGTTAGGGTAGGTAGGTQATPIDPTVLQVSDVRARSRISRRGARRNGLAASFLVPDGARALRVELHSTDRARAARLIGIKDVAVTSGGRQVVRLNSRRTRGLLSRPGLYRLVIQVGDGSQLGPRVVKRIRVVR